MREIKFRGKLVKGKKWVYGHYVFVDGKHVIFENGKPNEIIPETLGQFVGMCDKNEKEIFEGDIDNTDGELMYIAYCEGSFGLKYLNPDNWSLSQYFDPHIIFEELNIVGNIHDIKVERNN